MIETEPNPFSPIEIWEEMRVRVNESDDEENMVNARHYHVRFVVGESRGRRYVDGGHSGITHVSDLSPFLAPSIHRVPSEVFHYDLNEVESVVGEERIEEKAKVLKRAGQCDEHEIIEIAFQGPAVECCALTRDEANKRHKPVKYVAGYVLGRNNGLVKVALAKTVLESGHIYYEHIHIVPETAISNWSCLK